MIELIDIKKTYGDQIIFNGLNLKIDDGDFICVSGDSGSGKTTLLNIIGGLEPFDDGEILFDSKKIKTKKDRIRLFRQELGFIFQNFVLVENKTVKQNLELIRKEDLTGESLDGVLDLVGIIDKKDKKVYTLSGGEQQRVAMARLYLKKCRYVLADEPTGSLDKKNADKIFDIFKDLNARGKTIIIVTHDERLKSKIKRQVNLSEIK